MLIAHMEATKKFVGITADTGSDADIAVMVASTYHTGLIGSTYEIGRASCRERV